MKIDGRTGILGRRNGILPPRPGLRELRLRIIRWLANRFRAAWQWEIAKAMGTDEGETKRAVNHVWFLLNGKAWVSERGFRELYGHLKEVSNASDS